MFRRTSKHPGILGRLDVRLNVLGHVDVSWTSKRTLTYISDLIREDDRGFLRKFTFGRAKCIFSSYFPLQALVEEMDLDGDGVIDYREFHSMMSSMNDIMG